MSISHEDIVLMTKGFVMTFGMSVPAISIGKIVKGALDAIGRNPESTGRVFVPMLLGVAFVEAIAIYILVVVFTMK